MKKYLRWAWCCLLLVICEAVDLSDGLDVLRQRDAILELFHQLALWHPKVISEDLCEQARNQLRLFDNVFGVLDLENVLVFQLPQQRWVKVVSEVLDDDALALVARQVRWYQHSGSRVPVPQVEPRAQQQDHGEDA